MFILQTTLLIVSPIKIATQLNYSRRLQSTTSHRRIQPIYQFNIIVSSISNQGQQIPRCNSAQVRRADK